MKVNHYHYYYNLFRLSRKMLVTKKLAAFDFDNTIVNENTDTVVRSLLPKSTRPSYDKHGWTAYMQRVFELLHAQNIDELAIRSSIAQIQPIPGMPELIRQLATELNYDVIIISDSNSYFIDAWLKEYKLDSYITEVFTNSARFHNGLLKIQMYHLQDWCNLSEKNLCKGYILKNFISKKIEEDIRYVSTVYAGDGLNDFCPIVGLNSKDLACCRDEFKCAELVKNSIEGKRYKDTIYKINADVLYWKTGFEILEKLRSLS